MEAGPPLGYTFPTPKAGFRTGVHGSPSTSLTGCESSFGAELLCAHLSPRPGSPALPLSKLGLGSIPWLLQLEWKSALVCQPCTQPGCGSALSPRGPRSTLAAPRGATRGKVLGQAPAILLHPLPPCPSWYANPAGTTSHFPLGYGAFSLFLSITTPHSCAHLGPKSLVCSQSPPSLACCLHEESLAVPPGRYWVYLGFGDHK